MAVTYSEETSLGSPAPPFALPAVNPDADGREGALRRLSDYDGADALVVVFTCNHCPYARHIEDALVATAADYQGRGVAFVAISSNDTARYPADAPEAMAVRAAEKGFPFAYLFDETQAAARAYGAVCTPDLFVYDGDRRLAYRGRFDGTRPGQGTADGADLRRALDALLRTGAVTGPQHPAMGCSIKWR